MDAPTLLCAAFSARQIAMSARRSGIGALAVDFFGDLDLCEEALAAEVLHGDYPDGFDGEALIEALERLAHGRSPIGFVQGAGFEDRPELLDAIAARCPILGTGAASIAALKDPVRFSHLCESAGVAHPEIAFSAVERSEDWLSKRIGGCGGNHVKAAGPSAPETGRYLQRIVHGTRWSALFLADHARSVVLGFTRQWTDPTPEEPYRYGGAVGPLEPPDGSGAEMAGQIARLADTAARTGAPIVGVASADFVLSDDGPVLLEVNARFGATVDVFDRDAAPLLGLHLAACRGELPGTVAAPSTVRATGLAWAQEETSVPAGTPWPDFTRDRTAPPCVFAAGQPIATVVAEAADAETAVALFHERVATLRETLRRKAA